MIREIRELFAYHSQFTERQARHDCVNVFDKTIHDLNRVGFTSLEGKRVLDLGCGQRFPFSLQCAAAGAEVAALDIDYVKPSRWPFAFARICKHNGIKRALKSVTRQALFDCRYYAALEDAARKPLRSFVPKVSLITADPLAASYPLPAKQFHLIASNAVVEHVKDVSLFAAEVRRLLCRGGYFYGIIHNFYSLSGGHALEWAYPDESPSTKIPPWDHLRENRFPTWTYLNRFRPDEYKAAFAKHLRVLLFEGRDINHDSDGLEGELILTPELCVELSAYSRHLLLTRSYCVIGRKK